MRLRPMVLVTVFMTAISSGIAGSGRSSSSSSSGGRSVSKAPTPPNLCFASASRGSPASLANSYSARRGHSTTTIGLCRRRPLSSLESEVFSRRRDWSSIRMRGCAADSPSRRTTAVSCSSGGTTAAAAAAAEGSETPEVEEGGSVASALRFAPMEDGNDRCADSGGRCADSGGDPADGLADGTTERRM